MKVTTCKQLISKLCNEQPIMSLTNYVVGLETTARGFVYGGCTTQASNFSLKLLNVLIHFHIRYIFERSMSDICVVFVVN